MVYELVFTAAMSIPIFNTPRLVAVSLHIWSPLPLITQNSVLTVLLPAETSQENVPITSKGSEMHTHRASCLNELIYT